MELYLFIILGIAALTGVAFLVSFKLQDRNKHVQ